MGMTRLQDTAQGRELLKRIRYRLAELVAGGHLTVQERAEAGMVLGQLGDPRPGVGIKDSVPDVIWGKPVPAGTYIIGGDSQARHGFEVKTVTIKEAYQLARYPITNAQFAAFVNAPDVHRTEWWRGLPEGEKRFSESRWPYGNHPCTDVSWYQAVAFCRWLSTKLDCEVRLPHEYEWEVAARYNDGRVYPWGDKFDLAKTNTAEGGIGRTTAVGLYPSDHQIELDLYDMSGNVGEWCQNKYKHPNQLDEDYSTKASRVRRGGAWVDTRSYAHGASRNRHGPGARSYGIGWRVCRSCVSYLEAVTCY
jgi:formylglycine-generating enzyme required for sulfatase activity